MTQTTEPHQSSPTAAWQRVDTLLDRLSEKLEALTARSDLIGPEVVPSLRQEHAELRRELNILRDAYPETAPRPVQTLENLRERADRLLTSTTIRARSASYRLRKAVSGSRTNQALKESLGDLGRGAMRAGQELSGAMVAAVGRFRQRADKLDDSGSPAREPSSAPTSDRTNVVDSGRA